MRNARSLLLTITTGLAITLAATVAACAAEPSAAGLWQKVEKGKTVLENIEGGVKKIRDLLTRFDEVNNAFADPDDPAGISATAAWLASINAVAR